MNLDIEEFWVASLNSDKEVNAAACLFRGTVDHCLFHPRDVFRFVCLNNSSAFVVAHGHPSGHVQPSREEILITQQLFQLSMILEIPMTDHLIVSRRRYFSFLENGLLSPTSKDPLSPACP
jgi:DNA repair protein RadC